MYYEFFGLTHAPFKITPDTDVFFEGGNRGAILEALIYAITHGEGIIKVTGEVGSGKTMLCRVLQTRLPINVETVYLANPSVSPDEILHAIAFEMQLPVAKDASRLEVMHALNDYLVERHSQQRQVVVFVEESQGMPISTLEEIRLLSNLETQHHKLLQIVLFGQPELDENLRQQNIRQLRERITHSFGLIPLDNEDVRAYLTFRLQAAGYHGPDLFSRTVIAYMTKASSGLTRRLNLIADKALLAAFADGTHNVSLNHVKAAVRDSEFSDFAASRDHAPVRYAIAGLVLGGALGIGAFAAYQAFIEARGPVGLSPTPAAQVVTATPEVIVASNATAAPAAAGPAHAAPHEPTSPPETKTQVLPSAAVSAENPQPAARSRTALNALPTAPTTDLSTGASLPPDLLEQRLLATKLWLGEQNGGIYSIQLLGTNDPELLRDYFKTIAKYVEIEKVYVYRTTANKRPSMTVLYGTFGTRSEAIRTLETLPDTLKFNRPYYRTIQGIRSEIARQNS
jgi:type II secretory pathway predicted ATPase ExeA